MLFEIVRPSYAKINLCLQVCGRRLDGYHDLETVFQEIDLADEMRFQFYDDPKAEIALSCPAVNCILEENLVYQAAALFCATFQISCSMHISVEKNIPQGAGLGGGSSNAATTLIVLAERFGVAKSELLSLAKELGADVAFFLMGGTAIGRGRGDELEPIDLGLKNSFVVVCPRVYVSTAYVFAKLSQFLTHKPKRDIKIIDFCKENMTFTEDFFVNDLEEVSFCLYPQLEEVKKQLCEMTSSPVLMSGSGSSFFVVCQTTDEGRGILDLVRCQGYDGFLSNSVLPEELS
jgi:4-diphosphocytidyl-2-C-methyl-D-erythritol kinase